MRTKLFFCILCMSFLCVPSFANVYFKMESPKTELLQDEVVTVTLSAWVDDPAVTSTNGLNYWSLSAMVDTDSVVEVVDGSITLLAPVPTSSFLIGWNSINGATTGGTGSIDYLNVMPASMELDSDTGNGGYTAIAQFDIKAIGSVSDTVNYMLGDTVGFNGILKDWTTLDGCFDANGSDTMFTIVPEPSSFLVLSGLGVVGYFRRKKA